MKLVDYFKWIEAAAGILRRRPIRQAGRKTEGA